MVRVITYIVAALVAVSLAGLLLSAQQPGAWEGADYADDVMVIACVSDWCQPCKKLKEDYPSIHQRYPDLWWGWAHDGKQPEKVRQYKSGPREYGGKVQLPGAIPTIYIYRLDENRRPSLRFTMVGYVPSRDKEILALLIRRTSEG